MKKYNKSDVLSMLEAFQRKVLMHKPPVKDMLTELQMMRFKVKPRQGDFASVDFTNHELIEILWSLGKLDEFFQEQYMEMNDHDQETFISYFDSMQKKLQEDLNKLNLKQEMGGARLTTLEIEIFKERSKRRKLN